MSTRKPTYNDPEDAGADKADLLRIGRAAQLLLENPLVEVFFEEEDQRTWAALKAATMPAKPELYVGLHAYAMAIERLRDKLMAAKNAAGDLIIKQSQYTEE